MLTEHGNENIQNANEHENKPVLSFNRRKTRLVYRIFSTCLPNKRQSFSLEADSLFSRYTSASTSYNNEDSIQESTEKIAQIEKLRSLDSVKERVFKPGINCGGELVSNLIPKLLLVLDVEETVLALENWVDAHLLPGSVVEEKIFHDAFIDKILKMMPDSANVIESIRDASKNWFNKCYFDVLPTESAYSVLDSVLREGYSFLMKIGVELISALLLSNNDPEDLKALLKGNAFARTYNIDANALMKSARVSNVHCRRILEHYSLSLLIKNTQTSLDIESLSKYQWIGFDLDHCLIEYTRIEELLFKAVIHKLADESPLKDMTIKISSFVRSYNQYYLVKGLLVDRAKGNIIGLDENGNISCVKHGSSRIKLRDLKRLYPVGSQDSKDGLQSLQTRTECVFGSIVTVLGDLILLSRSFDWNKMCNRLEHIFLQILSPFHERSLTNIIESNPSLVVSKQKHSKKLLQILQKSGAKLFLLTNSSYEHVSSLMRASYGSTWQQLFDFVFVDAKKQKFFEVENRNGFGNLNSTKARNSIFKGGSLQEMSKLCGGQILYFGDHLMQDIVLPHSRNWSTVAIVENCRKLKNNPLLSLESSSPSLFCKLVSSHALLCVDSLESFAKSV